MIAQVVFFAAIFAVATAGNAATIDDEFSRNAVATFRSGSWLAEAAEFNGYSYSPQIGCRMTVDGATLLQVRPREQAQLRANLLLLEDRRTTGDNFEIEWVQIEGVRYETTQLPWRLAEPTADNIVLTFDMPLFAVRRDAASEWLPAAYLTLPLLSARSFKVGFRYEKDNHVVRGSRTISLDGFKEVTKWCGRELLRDRQNETRLQEKTR